MISEHCGDWFESQNSITTNAGDTYVSTNALGGKPVINNIMAPLNAVTIEMKD